MPPKTMIRGTRDAKVVDRENALKQDLAAMTPAEGVQWVEDNVKNMQDAKQHLKRLTRIVLALAYERR